MIAAAEPALVEALDAREGQLRILVAEVISMLPGAKAQQALLEAAIASDGVDQIDLFDLVSASARRFGNNATTRQVSAMRQMIADSDGDTADAIGRAYGALNVGPEEAVRLLIGK